MWCRLPEKRCIWDQYIALCKFANFFCGRLFVILCTDKLCFEMASFSGNFDLNEVFYAVSSLLSLCVSTLLCFSRSIRRFIHLLFEMFSFPASRTCFSNSMSILCCKWSPYFKHSSRLSMSFASLFILL